MPETRGVDHEARPDRRALVLLLLGLSVLLPHLWRSFATIPGPSIQQTERVRLLWLETPAAMEGGGLFLPTRPLADWQWLLTAFNDDQRTSNRPPVAPVPPASSPWLADQRLPAYLLADHRPPQPLPMPVRVAPIFFQRIAINQADLETLMTIPGIGRGLATAIISYRNREGGITNRSDLLAVEGIGTKKARMIESHVLFEPR